MSIELYNSDERIIEAIRSNDEGALAVLYKSYFGSVQHFIITNNGNDDDAKDVFQEAVIIFYEKLQIKDFVLTCKIKTYLYSVSRFIWLKKIKKASYMVSKITDNESYLKMDDDSNEMEEKELMFNKMEGALGQLGEPCKTLIEDFYIKQLSMNDISDKFGYTNADNAKTQKYKCLMRLKKIFFKQEDIVIK